MCTQPEQNSVTKDFLKLHLQFSKILAHLNWSLLNRISYLQSPSTSVFTNQRYIEKFLFLYKPIYKNQPTSIPSLNYHFLSSHDKSLLPISLNSAVAINTVPGEEIFTAAESCKKSLPKVHNDRIQFEAHKIPPSAKAPSIQQTQR